MLSKKYTLFLLLAVLFAGRQLSAQCGPGQSVLRLELDPDQYWYEVSWKITDPVTGLVYGQGECTSAASLSLSYCIPQGVCSEFRIEDEYGDGMRPDGSYSLYIDDQLVYSNPNGNYNYYEIVNLNCPPGTACETAIAITEGAHTTLPGGGTTWYEFTPTQNGIYELSTCFPENTCPTKVWVYGTECGSIVPTDNVTGTLFFNEGGCADGNMALATLFLGGGNTYYLRVGYGAASTCDTTAIAFNLSYVGGITGCTDSTACNFDPLASISGDCIYPGNPDCPNSPDLVVLQSAVDNSIQLDYLTSNDPCYVSEGCFRGFGQRTILRFTTHIKNIGEEDYYIGQAPATSSTPSDQFIWDPCHNHWHYVGYAEYLLYDEQGNRLPIGSKNGFCVLDLECQDGGDGKYTCGNMGISAQCGDIYDADLPCQWIDITDIPAGAYTFVMRVNWDQTPDKLGRVEKRYDNNWAQSCFVLGYGNNNQTQVEFVDDCPLYTDCEGTQYGNAVRDCEGVCNGTALHGDWNTNLAREMDDVMSYLDASLTDNDPTTTCRDLHENAHIDVYDAALLQECIIHGDDPDYWIIRFPCTFPTGKDNPSDIVTLRAAALNQENKTVDISVLNPFNKLIGFEFDLSGLVIDSVESLIPAFQPVISHNGTRISALSADNEALPKFSQPTAALRIHYSSITNTHVCMDSIIAVVNDKYQKSNAGIGNPSCLAVISSTQEAAATNSFPVQLVPNPASKDVSVFFPNPERLPSTIEVSDISGKKVITYHSIPDAELTLPRQELPSGVYMVRISNTSGSAVSRLVWQ